MTSKGAVRASWRVGQGDDRFPSPPRLLELHLHHHDHGPNSCYAAWHGTSQAALALPHELRSKLSPPTMFSPTRRLVFPHSYGPSSVPRNRLWICSASGIMIHLHRHLLELRTSYHRSFMDHDGSFRHARWCLVALCQVNSILDGQ